jgi:hypothetical protein
LNDRTALTSAAPNVASADKRRALVPPSRRSVPDSQAVTEEALVIDARGGLTPAEAVERKLETLLKGRPLPVSHLLNACRSRRPR